MYVLYVQLVILVASDCQLTPDGYITGDSVMKSPADPRTSPCSSSPIGDVSLQPQLYHALAQPQTRARAAPG
jgi:hypothetical protein